MIEPRDTWIADFALASSSSLRLLPNGTVEEFFNVGPVAVSPETLKALILVRDMYAANLKGFEERLWAIIHLSDSQRAQIARALNVQAVELNSAYSVMWHAWSDSSDIHDKWKKQYEAYLNQANRYEKRGDKEKAEELRADARESLWGLYLHKQAKFYRMLGENPLLGLAIDGRYLFQALTNDRSFLESTLPLLDRYLNAGQQQVAAEVGATANTWSIEGLWKFGGPRFRQQQEAISILGDQIGPHNAQGTHGRDAGHLPRLRSAKRTFREP